VRWPQFRSIGLIGPRPAGGECDWEVRMLAPSSGMSEDPITGSLNAAIAKWLQASDRLQKPYLVAQGTAIGRLGRVTVKTTPDGTVWVGGEVHIVIDGRVSL
jgi:PhzF family phenazine biosynthesis protein